MTTERDMLNLLGKRYNTERAGTLADRWVRAEHVRSTQNQARFCSIADFIAVDKYNTTQAMHGHEVKVSRSDWLSELKDLAKSERIKRYCDYWWLVVSDASIVKEGELPEDWGMLVKSGDKLRAKVKAPKLSPEPLTLDFVTGLTAAAQRTAYREPLHRDARTITIYPTNDPEHPGYFGVRTCQACGQISPCALHQPNSNRPAGEPRPRDARIDSAI